MSDNSVSDVPSMGRSPDSSPLQTRFRSGPGLKFFLICILTLLLMVPTLLVMFLTDDRSRRAIGVEREIASSWADAQLVNGPYIIVPVTQSRITVRNGEETLLRERSYVQFLPEDLMINAQVMVEQRKRGIFSVPVYRSNIQLNGRFLKSNLDDLDSTVTRVHLEEAFLVLGINDVRGIKNAAGISIDGAPELAFEPGIKSVKSNAGSHVRSNLVRTGGSLGLHRNLPPDVVNRDWDFRIELSLNGSGTLAFTPSGRSTQVSMTSPWPHPSFSGAFLPDQRTISDAGFEAEWSIPALARGMQQAHISSSLPLLESQFGTRFVAASKPYQSVERALKYSIAIIALTFVVAFLTEIRSNRTLHWVQYLLIGFALVMFYVLLLSLSEHLGYQLAFIAAALAVSAQIGGYVWLVTQDRAVSGTMTGSLIVLYAALYLMLSSTDYALLVGSLIAFISLSVMMYTTRNVDWSEPMVSQTAQPAK